MDVINLAQAFTTVTEYWDPRIAGQVNDSYIKVVKFQGPFCWHHHEVEDELFLVIEGSMRMLLRDKEVTIGPGEFLIVPHGVEHCPVADEECHVVLIEPVSTLNTGNVANEFTKPELGRV